MDYIIANIRITLPDTYATGHFARALEPFAVANGSDPLEDSQAALRLRYGEVAPAQADYCQLSTFDFPDAETDCRFGCDAAGYLFEMRPRAGGVPVCYRKGYATPEAVTDMDVESAAALARFGLWMMYNIAAAPLGAVAVHSSVVACNGAAILFLGESGTGKSTHTKLWRQHIAGATLLNDDSPVVRVGPNAEAWASGSPWSGKTPCYKNLQLPIRAIVRLSQAPHNHIRRLSPIEAIGALLPSCPPAFAHDEALQDAVCATLSAILTHVPAYHLECLPDAEATQLVHKTIFGAQ